MPELNEAVASNEEGTGTGSHSLELEQDLPKKDHDETKKVDELEGNRGKDASKSIEENRKNTDDLEFVIPPEEEEANGQEDENIVQETPILWYHPLEGDISITADNKIWKRVILEGEGQFRPGIGMHVSVHYLGYTLKDEVEFEDTRLMEPLEFVVGAQSTLIDAMEHAVLTMKKGEKAIFFCHPDYAFGKTNRVVESDSSIGLEVELLDWVDNCSSYPYAKIIRQRLEIPVDAKEDEYPKCYGWVEAEIEGLYDGQVFFPNRVVDFFVGHGKFENLPKGIDVAITNFILGEKSVLTIDPFFAFGEEGNEELGIPPSSKVTYNVYLKDFKNFPETPEAMSVKDRVFLCSKLSVVAQKLVDCRELERAHKMFTCIVKCFVILPINDNELVRVARELLFKAYVGQAKCLIKTDIKSAMKQIDRALQLQKESDYFTESDVAEALLSKAKVYLARDEPETGIQWLSLAKEKAPKNVEINRELENCQKLVENVRRQEKKLAELMLSSDK